ncbi:LETM1-related biofilm-associated protein [Olleya sp. YS]|uniref:LETM1-related biofilm-associated protein n=1 Tax=Olleya sp. YS TaxID=3028318 RepID=UPI0024344876|nr:LETM1-related biofilm-associated protein [Olleya sp. YS]WGD35006.1 LETM1-related biofilm-associated protein [Olleya sp. YS]
MNPSATGWIKKLIKELNPEELFKDNDLEVYYRHFRDCGFIYGSNVKVVNDWIENEDFESDEICKINLVIALHIAFTNHNTTNDFYTEVANFYNKINKKRVSFLEALMGSKNKTDQVERIINKRIQIDDNLIDKSFNYFITNALLFVDVLAFRNYLKTGEVAEETIREYEAVIESIVLNTLNSKKNKSDYDKSLIDLFEQSLRYQRDTVLVFSEAISTVSTNLFARYCLDLAAMATWTDAKLDNEEELFLNTLGEKLNLSQHQIDEASKTIEEFYKTYREKVPLLGSKNIVKTFYDNSSNMVLKLIKRNSKRLTKELSESKELLVLLSHSTVRDLSKDEQKKVQDQLLDIFKSVPSLAIFLLPGGALLLPLVVKFIPKLLPSAFDDNRIEDDKEQDKS